MDDCVRIAIAVFTAGITSTLTRKELQGAVHTFDDLRSVRVGALANSATTDYLTREQLPFRTFPDIQAGLAAVSHGEIDAIVHDKPLLAWMVRKDFSTSVRMVDTSFSSESYAILLPKGSPLRPMLDAAVLDQIESDWWQQTLFETIGNGGRRDPRDLIWQICCFYSPHERSDMRDPSYTPGYLG
jgi:ABC-type amino acid transport substrate-binding protein